MLIRLKNIIKTYQEGSPAEVKVLKGVNLEIAKEEMIAILGRSGSGKSTLLNILACLDNPTSGEYLYDGEDVSKYDSSELARFRNREIGFVLQDFALINDQKVSENVATPLMFDNRYSYKEVKQKVKEILDKLSISHLSNKPCKELSGGQKQRVAIARALVNNPSLILADEPSGSLDEQTADEVMKVFKEVHAMGKTLIIVTHDIQVASFCEKQYRIENGIIRQEV